MNKVQIVCWYSGNGIYTDNRSHYIEMPDSELNEKFHENAMRRVREDWPAGAKEVINIINHGNV